ncbi:hypothetical protein OG746_29305 [Streptomyces sp. NBC_01016]|uniref:hypothetical protein n=1 Tax=Streptomyces sp. NBC_01016 TaxID=2903720 RepID=UPI0022595FE7|nr:hypothetical protein [Streptomyces sp. NBC_01016]MCX4832836.1 hypothetical protein [Streptomyces sp. NBC_01016]
MDALRPRDLEHLANLDYALPRVAVADPAGFTDSIALYGAVLAALQDADCPEIPLGSFIRLVKAAGFRRCVNVGPKGWSYFEGIDLRDEAA